MGRSWPVCQSHQTQGWLQQEAERYDQQAKAINTRKAYRVDWDDFQTWCSQKSALPLPATPETVRLYLVDMATSGLKVATIKRRLSSISTAHEMRGQENPTRSAVVTTTMQGIRRTLGTAQTQKAPTVTGDLARLVDACESLTSLAAARDLALLLLGCTGAFRRSELVALDVSNMAETREGIEVTDRNSKTDQEGAGATVAIPYSSHVRTCRFARCTRGSVFRGSQKGSLWREIDRHGNLGPVGCTLTRLPGWSSAPAAEPASTLPASPVTRCARAWPPRPVVHPSAPSWDDLAGVCGGLCRAVDAGRQS